MKKEQTTDESSWNFHLTRSVADLYDVTLEIHIKFWLSALRIWFRGYQTPERCRATIWGKKVDLYIATAPLGTPSEILPVIKENTTRSKNARLPSEQQIYVSKLQKKVKSLKKHLSSKVDEMLERRCLDEVNVDRIKAIIRKCDAAWGDKGLSVEEKINRLVPYKIEIYNLVSILQLPDESVRADMNIFILMATILCYAQSVEKNARKYGIRIPKLVHQSVKLVDSIITRMNETQNKLSGVERDVTKEEYKTYNAYLDIKIRAKSALCLFGRQLELYEQLWEVPSLSTNTKIECLSEAVELVRKRYGKKAESRCPHAPLARKHLQAISGYLNKLEEEGKTTWQLRMADELFPTTNAWREDCDFPALSKEGFTSQIELQSVHIKTKEKEEGFIHCELELFFQDTEDTFAGHFLYATVGGDKVEEVTLVEQT